MDHVPARKQALVIGGSGAIGAAICNALARDGFDVALTFLRNEVAASETAASINGYRVTASVHQLDLTDVPAVERLLGAYDSLDAVVYAAGPFLPMGFVEAIQPRDFAQQLNSDASAFFNLVHHALPRLKQAKGALVGIVTAAITRTVSRDLLSAAPKAVVEQIIRAVAVEYGRFGVRANCVAPGLIDGGVVHDLVERGDYTPAIIETARKSTPLRSLGTPEDVAEAVSFMCSSKARWITGQTLFVDGGYSR